MKNSNSDIFSRLTNTKNGHKGQGNKGKSHNEPKLESFEILSVTSKEVIVTGTYTNGKEVIERELGMLENIDSKNILNEIKRFQRLDLETVSDKELSEVLGNIVVFNSVKILDLTEDTNIYRARNHTFKFETATAYFNLAKEIWYPGPELLTKLGRLNKERQPIMYAAFDAITPIHEIRSQNDSQFALMKYKIKSGQQLKMACVAVEEGTAFGSKIMGQFKLSKKAKENWRIINKFLVKEFTKKVPSGKEYMYRSTNELLRSFNVPGCDGFVYPSMESAGGYNLAIKPFAADRAVEFTGLAYFQNANYKRAYNTKRVNPKDFYVHQYWSTSIENEKIIYQPIGPCRIDFHKAINIVKGEEGETEHF